LALVISLIDFQPWGEIAIVTYSCAISLKKAKRLATSDTKDTPR
jgi:hypothetical protein